MVDIPNHTVEIDGFPLFAEEVKPVEKYQRREFLRTSIMMGSEFVTKSGAFVPREFTFVSNLEIDLGKPDTYDSVFAAWNNNICNVISREFGGSFNAEVHVTPTHDSPLNLQLDVKIKEVAKITVKV